MAEYIEREAAIAEIIAEAEKEGKKSFNAAERDDVDISVKYTHGEYCYHVAAHIVETLPTADVSPVKHGTWLPQHYEGGVFDGQNVDKCSLCGFERLIDDIEFKTTYRFCPNCGARMEDET